MRSEHIHGNLIKYRRAKNHQPFVCPFRGFPVKIANKSGFLFERQTNIWMVTRYINRLCDLPFSVTPKTMRKTFGSIIWYEVEAPTQAKQSTIMKAYGHKSWTTTCVYLGIQDEDLEKAHELLGL